MRIVAGIAMVIAFGLTGCAGPEPAAAPTASSAAPVFASEEEALAAAEEVLDRYTAATDLVGVTGGKDLSGFDGLLTEEQRQDEEEQAAGLISEGKYLQGHHEYSRVALQNFDQTNGTVFLQLYLCLEIADVRYIDSEGNDTSVEGHDLSLPMEVVVVSQPDNPRALLIEDVRRWTDENFCS